MSMKKKALMGASYVLVAAMAIGGTVAYLTDRDNATNTFTVGDVSIELNEEFDQGAQLIPNVKIEKKPTITNVGKSDAYVWMTFSIPAAMDNPVQGTETGSNENTIHWNPLGATADGYVTEDRVNNAIEAGYLPKGTTVDTITASKSTWNVFDSLGDGLNMYAEEINGVDYNTYVLLYNGVLEEGETTLPSIYQVYLDAHVDITPDGDMYRVEKGKATDLKWNVNDDGAPVIYVNAYGIQADGFENVEEAYDAYVGQWNADGAKTPLNGEHEDVTVVSTTDELATALEADGDVIINANGAEVNMNAMFSKTNVPAGTTVSIVGANVTGRSYGNKIDGTVVFENCTFNNPDGAYSIHFDGGKGDVVFNNCELNGWVSFGSLSSVEMNNCTIGGNGMYAMVRFYQDAVLNNCTFDGTDANTEDAFTDGISAVNGANVVLNDCNVTNATYETEEGGTITEYKNGEIVK